MSTPSTRRYDWNSLDEAARTALLARPVQIVAQRTRDSVAALLADVQARGDDALREITARFDGVDLAALEVDAQEFAAAREQVSADLIAAIESGRHVNEAKQVAESTLTAIMGRMAAYTGQEVTWEQALNSQESLSPAQYAFGPCPLAAVAMPGKTPLV